MKRKRNGVLHHNTITHLEKKLSALLRIFKPIPFVAQNALSISSKESLLKRAGLWDFVHIKFDSELRTDLIAQLVVSYSPQAPPHRRCVVNGLRIKLDKLEMAGALGLSCKSPSSRRRKVEGEDISCGLGGVSKEDVLFLEKVVFNWVVLGGGEDVLDEAMRLLWNERRPEKVDWAGLVWAMVEKEVVKGVELEECCYASHLQYFLRKVKPSLFAENVEKEGFDRDMKRKVLVGYERRNKRGILVGCRGSKLDAVEEMSGLAMGGESENEVKGLVGYQSRNHESDKMVGCEELKLESAEEVSSLGFEKEGGGEEEGKLDAVIFGEGGKAEMVVALAEEGESTAVEGKHLLEGEVGDIYTVLIAEEGKEVYKQDVPVMGEFGDASAMAIENEKNGSLYLKHEEIDKVILQLDFAKQDDAIVEGTVKTKGLFKEGDCQKISTSDNDNGKELEKLQSDLILNHGEIVEENQAGAFSLRQVENGKLLIQANQDDYEHYVEVSSSGNSSLNQLESLQIDSNIAELVEEEDIVDFEDGEEKDKDLSLFQHCSPTTRTGFDSRSEKAVEVREENIVDFEDSGEKNNEQWLFHQCSSQSIDAGLDSRSDEVVELSEDEDNCSDSARNLSCSPRSNVNDCSFVEPFVSGPNMKMEMTSSDFLGNALRRKNANENDNFVEPFVLEHNSMIADISATSVFENSLKAEIDHLNDGHKRQRTEDQLGKEPLSKVDMTGVYPFPVKRTTEHASDDVERRPGSEGRWNPDLMDFNSCKEQADMWLAQTKMIYAAREEAWIGAQLEEQKLVKKLEHIDNTIRFCEESQHGELRERNLKINSLENDLFFMANQIGDYKKALQAVNKSFAAYRDRCGVPEEPLYRDVQGSGGMVISTSEWEKQQLRQEEKERYMIDLAIKAFQLDWSDNLDEYTNKIMTLHARLSDAKKELEDLKSTFQNRNMEE